MRMLFARTVFLTFALAVASASEAQSLSQSLREQSAASLAKSARKKGDAVRGAILFSQKKLNCATCHQPGASDLLGPDLSRADSDLPDEHFVESLLEPSKVIKKGFESVKVLTNDGRLLVGRVLRETEDSLTLRENSGSNRIERLGKQTIEQISSNPISIMPAELVDQLADQQQFLDLVKYLIDLSASGAGSGPHASAQGGEPIGQRLAGLALLDHYRCDSCHAGETQNLVPASGAPNLRHVASRIDRDYLRRYIADPHGVKPGTAMPDLLGNVTAAERDVMADLITAYLVSLSEGDFERTPVDAESAARGAETFHTVGCVACHSPRDDAGIETLADDSVALGNLPDKYSVDSLTRFLKDPHTVRPQGRMPSLLLSHWEAVDLANYLLRDSSPSDADPSGGAPSTRHDPARVESGRASFAALGCANCHDLALPRSPAPALAQVREGEGCLSAEPGRKVHFAMKESERAAINVALRQLDQPIAEPQAIHLAMQTLRCFQCHQRDGFGGVTDARDLFFHSENENLGPQGRIPPTLTSVGAKLKPKWMRQVLVSGRAIRPYLKTRMPQYGTRNVEPLVAAFASVDSLGEVTLTTLDDPKEMKKVGTQLVGRDGLNCVACHTFQQKPAQTMPAVDLTEMAERLQPEWFETYMRSPQRLSPGTVMPSFWPGGKAIRKEILDGDTDVQIAAIWEYLKDGRQARTPRGLNLKPIELLAGEEAVMLRRSYQGIGKRGIGVGYPGGVNLAFDAEQLRLAMIWKGQFADPGGTWRGQGSGTVRPLSREVIRFAAGPDLDDAESPWIVDDGRPPLHQFTGYFLDQAQRPTFTYRFEHVEVEDHSAEFAANEESPRSIRRTIRLSSDHERKGLVLRVASGTRIESVGPNQFRIDDRLRVRIEAEVAGEQTRREQVNREKEDRPSELQLVLPLDLARGKTEINVYYEWINQ